MMKKSVFCLTAALIMTLLCAAACAESLYVDNRETDQLYSERLNLRAQPSSDGDLLGLYYSGTQVATLGEETSDYVKVDIAGVTGYMAKEYLITQKEAIARYGEGNSFFDGRQAQVDLSGMWMTRLPVYEKADAASAQVTRLENGAQVRIKGIIGDEWAYIAVRVADETRIGYVTLDALTDVGNYKALVVAGEKADSGLTLYSWPSEKAKEIMTLKNGTACLNLFGRSVGGWRKVRVGGVTGWIREKYNPGFRLLSETERAAIPYYPLQMQTRHAALLFSAAGDVSKVYMTLGEDMKVEVLAECGDYVFVRTLEGGAGAFDRGDYGYVSLEDLTLSQSAAGVALAQVDDMDLPAVVLAQPDPQAEIVGALCAGAQVRVTDFTQTDYVQVKLGRGESAMTGYVLKHSLRFLSGDEGELTERIPQRASLIREYQVYAAPDLPYDKESGMPVLTAGDRVYMFGVVGGWAYVRAAGTPSLDVSDDIHDCTGFIELSALNAPASTMHLTAFVNADKVNMRKEGSANAGIVAKAKMGERLRIADYGTEWTCVVTPDGKRGYLMTKYLDFEQK